MARLPEVPAFRQMTIGLVRARAAWQLQHSDLRPQLQAIPETNITYGWAGHQIEALLLIAQISVAIIQMDEPTDDQST